MIMRICHTIRASRNRTNTLNGTDIAHHILVTKPLLHLNAHGAKGHAVVQAVLWVLVLALEHRLSFGNENNGWTMLAVCLVGEPIARSTLHTHSRNGCKRASQASVSRRCGNTHALQPGDTHYEKGQDTLNDEKSRLTVIWLQPSIFSAGVRQPGQYFHPCFFMR